MNQLGIFWRACFVFFVITSGPQWCGASEVAQASTEHWFGDYFEAHRAAKEAEKFLLIYFYEPTNNPTREQFEQTTLQEASIKRSLDNFVLVKIPTTTKVEMDGIQRPLLRHGAFVHMNGRQGLVIVDLKHQERDYYGKPVSCLPFESSAYFAPTYWGTKSVSTLLALPPGTLTQRMLTFAVRCHPERPASANGQPHPQLFEASRRHSNYQAQIRQQGHHNWNSRFHEIHAMVGGEAPTEVCAESWPGEGLLRSCFSCVYCWRQSSGHWRSVSSRQPAFGYDISLGSNGIWYATGIFGGFDRQN
ncbi:MAG: hypothetical protein P8N76_10665 [Pirellulaceae bacterium]|nr:hypothetical protein [Pirellulaceae bacterium]